MLLAIIGGIFCMTMGALMYTPKMRTNKLHRPVAFLFIFEGIWILADYIFRQIFPDNVFMQAVHCIAFFSVKMPERKIIKKRSFEKKSSGRSDS